MRHDIELAYLGIEVPDPAALSPFFGDVIGLVPGEPDGATLTWRNDDAVQRILVEPGPANDATRIGFEATDAAAFAAVVERLRTAGHDVREGTADEKAARRVTELVHTDAPWGVRVEIVQGLGREPGGIDGGGWGYRHSFLRFGRCLRPSRCG